MANEIYLLPGTAVTWTDSGGDNTMTFASLAADGVRVGAQDDLGSAARPRLYAWRFVVDGFSTAPVVGETVDVYLATGDGTYIDGNVGASDAAGSTAQLPNLLFLGSATVQTTSTTDDLVISGQVELSHRYVSPVVHNNTADALSGGRFILQPVPDQIQ